MVCTSIRSMSCDMRAELRDPQKDKKVFEALKWRDMAPFFRLYKWSICLSILMFAAELVVIM